MLSCIASLEHPRVSTTDVFFDALFPCHMTYDPIMATFSMVVAISTAMHTVIHGSLDQPNLMCPREVVVANKVTF